MLDGLEWKSKSTSTLLQDHATIQHLAQIVSNIFIQHVGWCWTNILDSLLLALTGMEYFCYFAIYNGSPESYKRKIFIKTTTPGEF